MAELNICLEDNLYKVKSEEVCLEFPASSADNQKALILFLRSFKRKANGKHGLFTQKQIAEAIPDFEGATQQSIREHERRFEESGKDMRLYLNRKRKVDQQVVEAIEEELKLDPLASKRELASGVNLRLGREDISENNIEAGLEQIPASEVRRTLKQQMEKGEIRYREQYLLEKSFSALQSQDQNQKQGVLTLLERAQINSNEQEEEGGMKVTQVPAAMLKQLCEVGREVRQIPIELINIVICLRLYGLGLGLKAIGQCMGVNKTTILRWIIGLAIGLYPIIYGWIKQRVKGSIVYLDEKWIKIRGKWHYWFVALDAETQLPILEQLMPGRNQWYCQWILMRLKLVGYSVKVIVTDGLAGYLCAIPRVFKQAIHQLCLFHHQQNVTKFAKEHFTDEQEREERKREMKAVFQTEDKRTVRNRLSKLETKSEAWGIVEWVKSVTEQLSHLLPAVGSRRIPKTSNAIERFFRAFNQFYKRRNGFFSVLSAERQLKLFLVFYLFTQGENGIAPIETIMPEVRQMPLYKLMNSPFTSLGLWPGEVKENQPLAQKQLEEAA